MPMTCPMLASDAFVTSDFLTTDKPAIWQLLAGFFKHNIYIIVSGYALFQAWFVYN